jgi:hypothetical protein
LIADSLKAGLPLAEQDRLDRAGAPTREASQRLVLRGRRFLAPTDNKSSDAQCCLEGAIGGGRMFDEWAFSIDTAETGHGMGRNPWAISPRQQKLATAVGVFSRRKAWLTPSVRLRPPTRRMIYRRLTGAYFLGSGSPEQEWVKLATSGRKGVSQGTWTGNSTAWTRDRTVIECLAVSLARRQANRGAPWVVSSS